MSYLALAKKAEEKLRRAVVDKNIIPPRALIVKEVFEEAKLKAVLIYSAFLDDHLYLILDDSFIPKDRLAYYYSEEISLLKQKSPEEIQEIHKAKLTFPGCRVIQ
jgi:hypothetical protein